MNHVDVTEEIYDAYRAWARSRDLNDAPPPLFPSVWLGRGTIFTTGDLRIGDTTVDNQFIYQWSDNTTNSIDVTAFGDTNRMFLPTLIYNEI